MASGGFVTLHDGSEGWGCNLPLLLHRACATIAATLCPHLSRARRRTASLAGGESRLIYRTDVVPGMEALAATFPSGLEVVYSCYRLFSPEVAEQVRTDAPSLGRQRQSPARPQQDPARSAAASPGRGSRTEDYGVRAAASAAASALRPAFAAVALASSAARRLAAAVSSAALFKARSVLRPASLAAVTVAAPASCAAAGHDRLPRQPGPATGPNKKRWNRRAGRCRPGQRVSRDNPPRRMRLSPNPLQRRKFRVGTARRCGRSVAARLRLAGRFPPAVALGLGAPGRI